MRLRIHICIFMISFVSVTGVFWRSVVIGKITRSNQGPKIKFHTTNFNFGQKTLGEEVEHRFKFTNTGDALLKVSVVKTSCPCTIEELNTNGIRPGQSGNMLIKLRAARLGNIHESITLKTNDPSAQQIVLHIRGKVVLGLRYVPDALFFETIKGNGGERAIELKGPPKMRIKNVSCDAPYISLTVKEFFRDFIGTGYVIRVKLSEKAPVGEFSTKLMIKTNLPTSPEIKIPVQGVIKGELQIDPPRIFFGFVAPSIEMRKDVVISRQGKRGFRVTSVSASHPAIKVSEPIVLPNVGYGFQVTVNPSKAGFIEGEIIVGTNVKGEDTLKVPVGAYVEER